MRDAPLLYPAGLACAWIATDRDGLVGAFITGGAGPIPVAAMRSTDPRLEDIEALVHALPCTSAVHLQAGTRQPDLFDELAQRGLQVYDWRDALRSAANAAHAYELVATPETPLACDALPGALRRLAETLHFDKLSFARKSHIDVRAAFECLVPDPG